MKRQKTLLCLLCLAALFASVFCIPAFADNDMIPYTQYASGGTPTDLEAVILFENSNKTFTKYQVAYTPEEAAIRQISLGELDGVTVGLWGDSNPIMGHPDYTAEYMDENLVQKLVGTTKADYDAWEGYGDVIEAVDADAVSGATVSVSNMTSVIKALFQYHADKYYS